MIGAPAEARYFFNVYDGEDILDDDGTELASVEQVRYEAGRTAGGLLREGGRSDLWSACCD
jgi:hypothetical protein